MGCARGDPGVQCMRSMPGSNGICPVADEGVDLMEANEMAVDIFFDLLRTAKQVQGERKTAFYVHPSQYVSMTQIYELDEEERLANWKKVCELEEVWNETRPMNKKPKNTSSRTRRRRR